MKQGYNYPQDKYFTDISIIDLKPNKRDYDFISQKNIENCKIIGVMAFRQTEAGNVATPEGAPLAADDVFNAAYLRIKKGNTDVHSHLPLSMIEAATKENPGYGYPLNLTNIHLSNSGIKLAPSVSPVEDTAIMLLFVYEKI